VYTITFVGNLKTIKIPRADYIRIREKIALLAQDPRPRWSEKLKGLQSYRVPIGNYRIIYKIDDKMQTIVILDIGHRKDIYN
jgi:mRNA interferase RelE/StbE